MRFSIAILAACVMVACGGGAGTVGIASGTALFTTAPSAVTIALGTVSYSIGGGTAPYKSSSSNINIVATTVTGSTLTMTGLIAGNAQVTITDATGSTLSIALTVGSGTTSTALFTTAPSTVTLAVGANATFSVGGGIAPYVVNSNNAAVATVGVNGKAFIVSGITAGSSKISIFDASGSSLSFDVTVGSGGVATALYVTAASAITLATGATNTFTIGGGTPAYAATSSNTNIATVSVAANTLSVHALAAGAAQILVFDSTGSSVSTALTVSSSATPTPLYTTSPSAVSVATGASNNFTIGGGTAPYSATSGNLGVATVSVSGSALTISGVAGGTTQVLVFDATGSSVAIDVTTSQNGNLILDVQPDGATGNVGDVLTFLVSGGSPAYTINVNNPSIATVSPNSLSSSGASFSATLLNAGSTSVTILDALGQSKTFTLTVSQLSTSLRLSPSTMLIAEDSTNSITLNVFGGTGPYRAFTSDQTLSAVSTSAATVTVALGSNLNRCINPIDSSGVRVPNGTFDVTITVLDSLGASATAIVTIKDNGVGSGAVATQPAPFVPPCT